MEQTFYLILTSNENNDINYLVERNRGEHGEGEREDNGRCRR